MQIRTKLTIRFTVIAASILFFSLCSIYYFSEKHRENEFYNALKNKAFTTADLLIKVQEVDSSLLKIIDKNKKDVFHYENISVYDYVNKEIYTNNDSINFIELLPQFHETINQIRLYGEKRIEVGEMEIIGLSYIDRFNRFVILSGAIDKYGLENLKNLKNILTIVFLIVLLAVAIAGWIYAGRALKPISSVINEVDKISGTNLNLRLNEGNRKDEIARLSSTFNKMLNRIESAFKLQKTFVATASHELRNPLTMITSQLEVSLLKERNNGEYKKIISSVLDDIKNLNKISHGLLQLAKIDSAESDLGFSPVRMDDLIWETKTEFLSLYPECKVNFFIDNLPEDEKKLTINGIPQYLKICFFNLMENACKFSSDNTVTLKLFSEQKQIVIHFTDKGSGINQNDLPNIFEPFYRGEYVLYKKGYGIGLSIVKKIILLHNAQITVNSELKVGTTFILIFPLS
ncbi:MAG: HAMP domain-containing histidine kinase [Bacteroidetes bacterium]|nr:HAMP domain-containing histidine kinase [Bacteroidota bacterium]